MREKVLEAHGRLGGLRDGVTLRREPHVLSGAFGGSAPGYMEAASLGSGPNFGDGGAWKFVPKSWVDIVGESGACPGELGGSSFSGASCNRRQKLPGKCDHENIRGDAFVRWHLYSRPPADSLAVEMSGPMTTFVQLLPPPILVRIRAKSGSFDTQELSSGTVSDQTRRNLHHDGVDARGGPSMRPPLGVTRTREGWGAREEWQSSVAKEGVR